MADNPIRSWFRVERASAKASGSSSSAVVYINDAIGYDIFFGGVNASELITEIDGLQVDQLDVRINSEGGSAYDGLAIANAIIRNPAKTTCFVDGIAASAASLIALAGDTVVISEYGQMMIHDAVAGVMGSAADMRSVATYLDGLNASMAQFYADRTGEGDAKSWAKAMAAETWYTAEAALAAGLVTTIDESAKREDVVAAVAAAMARPTARFKHPAAAAAGHTGAAVASVTTTETQEGTVPLSEKVAERLGLAADATDDDVLAKLDELSTPETPAVEPDLATAVAVVKSAGQAVIDAEAFERLRQAAEEGSTALAKITAAAHAKVVDDAIGQGKILPTQRDQYMALMSSNAEVTSKLLADTPVSAMVPVAEIGHSLEAQAKSDSNLDDPRFKDWKF